MSEIPVVGDASVVVRAITNQVRGDIRRSLQDARPDVRAEGAVAGKEYSDGFSGGIGNKIQDSLKGAFAGGGASQAASSAGSDAGRSFTQNLSSELKGFDLRTEGERLGKELGDGMVGSVSDAADQAGSEAERALGGAGGRGGNAFKQAMNSAFADSAISASRQFTILIASSNIVGSAIGTLVSSLSAAVSGLFAMGAAASQAAGAIAVLPGILGVAAQSMGTLKLAFSGVGDAVKAGFAPAAPAVAGTGAAARAAADAVAGAADAVRNAMDGVTDAQRNLGRVVVDSAARAKDARDALVGAYRDAAESAADASQKVADAEGKVLDAERQLLTVQQDLNRAREVAAEQLQQLAFSAEGAALAEERAGIRLQDARDKLVAVSTLPPDDRARKEAELSFKEAELSFRQAKDRNSDLAKEQAKAAKAGVEGSQEVLDVRAKISSAEQKVIDAEKNLADARKDQAKDARDSAESIAAAQDRLARTQLTNSRAIADAQEGVADAQSRLADAQDKLAAAQKRATDANTLGAAASNKYKDALAQLSPAAQTFVKYLVSLQAETKKLKTAAGNGLFPGLQAGLEPIVKNVFPVLVTQLGRTGSLLGTMAQQFGSTIATGEGLRNLTTIFQEQNDTLDIFAVKGANGRSAIENLAIVFTRLGVAIQPITQRFASWIAQLTGTAEAATSGEAGMTKLTGFFQRAGDTAAQLGRIFGNLATIVLGLGKAADESGKGLLTSFEEATKKLSDFIALPSTQTELKKFFEDAATNLRAIGTLVNAIGLEFLSLGDNQGVAGFATNLLPAIDNIGKIGDAFTNAGPELGAFLSQLTELFVNLTQGEAIQKFISNLTAVLKVLNSLTGSGFGAWALGIAASIAAFTRVAALVLIPLRFFFKALVGGPIGVVRGFQSMLSVFGRIPKAFAALRNGGGLPGAFAAMSKGSKGAEKAFNEQMVTDKRKITTLKALETQALRTSTAMNGLKVAGAPAKGAAAGAAVGAAQTAASGVAVGGGTGAAATKAAAGAVKAAAPVGKLAGVFGTLGKSIGLVGKGLLGFLGGPIGIAITVLPILITIFKKLYDNNEGFRKFIDNLVAKFKEAIDWIVKNVFPVFASIGRVIAEVFVNQVIPVLKILWVAIQFYIGLVIGYIKIWIEVIKFVIMNVLVPIFTNVLIPLFMAFYNTVKFVIETIIVIINGLVTAFVVTRDAISAALRWIGDRWNDLQKVFAAIYDKYIAPKIAVVRAGFQTIADKVRDVVAFFLKKWDDFRLGLAFIYDKYIAPKIEAVKNKFAEIGTKVRDVVASVVGFFGQIPTGITTIYDKFIKPAIDRIKNGFQEIVTKAGEIVTSVTEIFKKFKDAPAEGIKGLVKMLNDNLIGNVNKIGDVFGFHIPDIPIPAFADGGLVRGRGGPRDDKILARLSDKEFVVNARDTARNLPILKAMNSGRSPLGVLPTGGWNPFEDVKDGVSGFLGDGLAKALEKLVKPFADKYIPQSSYAGKFFHSIIPKLIETMKKWGDKKETSFVPEGGMLGTGRSGAYGGVKPWVAAAGDLIRKLFGVKDVGGVGGRPNASDHPTGHALDFMVYQNKALGDRIAAYMLLMHDQLRVTYLIWYKRIVSAKNGWKWRGYTHPNGPTSNRTLLHMDHVHASFQHGVSMKPPIALASGGIVRATPGGVFAQIAEAGRSERVEPLDRQGLSNRDRALVDMLRDLVGQGGRGDTFQVYPAPGMNEVELAATVSRQVAFKRRTGT